MPITKKSGLVKKLIYCFYLLVVTAFLLEVSVRFIAPQPLPQHKREVLHQPNQHIGWTRIPNAKVLVNSGERDVWVCTDHMGDRVDCNTERTQVCDHKILILGDSFVEALAIPYRQTAWSRLEQSFDACAYVSGVGAYYPGQYVIQAKQRLDSSQAPDFNLVVLNLFSGNDFVDTIDWVPPPEMVATEPFRVIPNGFSTSSIIEWLTPYKKWFESRSHAFVLVLSAIRDTVDSDRFIRDGIPPALLRSGLTDKVLKETARSIELIADMTTKHDIKLVVSVIPIRNQVLDPSGQALLGRYPELGEDLDMDLVSKKFIPLIEEIEGVDSVIDLTSEFRMSANATAWGTRDPHLSPYGHELWFEAIKHEVAAALGEEL